METNKQRWRRLGNVEYISIEVRPPRKDPDKARCQVTLDWCPNPELGAYEAFEAIQKAVVRLGREENAKDLLREFYDRLREVAEEA